MKENIYFRQIPAANTVYKVMEGCCYERVVYDGPEIGFATTEDHGNEFNGVLICYCDPKLNIIPITEETYYNYFQDVKRRLATA